MGRYKIKRKAIKECMYNKILDSTQRGSAFRKQVFLSDIFSSALI